MNDFIIGILDNVTYISSILAISLGALIVISLPIIAIGIIINIIYKHMEVSYYFISFVRHRKEFMEWRKQQKNMIG